MPFILSPEFWKTKKMATRSDIWTRTQEHMHAHMQVRPCMARSNCKRGSMHGCPSQSPWNWSFRMNQTQEHTHTPMQARPCIARSTCSHTRMNIGHTAIIAVRMSRNLQRKRCAAWVCESQVVRLQLDYPSRQFLLNVIAPCTCMDGTGFG